MDEISIGSQHASVFHQEGGSDRELDRKARAAATDRVLRRAREATSAAATQLRPDRVRAGCRGPELATRHGSARQEDREEPATPYSAIRPRSR
jgi:hypothetical protein